MRRPDAPLRAYLPFVIFVVIAGAALRLLGLLFHTIVEGDGCHYAWYAREISRHGLEAASRYWIPAWAWLLAVVEPHLDGDWVTAGRLVNVTASILTPAAAWWTARRVAGPLPALAAAVLVAVHPLLLKHASLVLVEPLFVLLAVTALGFALDAFPPPTRAGADPDARDVRARHRPWIRAAAAGVLLGVAQWFRGEALPIALALAVVGPAAAVACAESGRRLRAGGSAALCALVLLGALGAAVLPMQWVLHRALGGWGLHSKAVVNLEWGDAFHDGDAWYRGLGAVDPETFEKPEAAVRVPTSGGGAASWLLRNPGRAVERVRHGLPRVWSSLRSEGTAAPPVLALFVLAPVLVIPLGRRLRYGAWLLWLVTWADLGLYALTHVRGRFLQLCAVLACILAVAAAAGIGRAVHAVLAGSHGRRVAAGAATVLAVLLPSLALAWYLPRAEERTTWWADMPDGPAIAGEWIAGMDPDRPPILSWADFVPYYADGVSVGFIADLPPERWGAFARHHGARWVVLDARIVNEGWPSLRPMLADPSPPIPGLVEVLRVENAVGPTVVWRVVPPTEGDGR